MTRLAVIGGGWAGISAAVLAIQRGHEVTLFEMARQLGGRARSLDGAEPGSKRADGSGVDEFTPDLGGYTLDNGQHILIGAYSATLALMRHVGVDTDAHFWRSPLCLVDPAGRGLRLPGGNAMLAFSRATLWMKTWPWPERIGLLNTAGRWALGGFRCAPELTVAALCAKLGPSVRHDLIDPLCVSALNTPAERASAAVFLRVLRDSLFSGPGAADLLLPRHDLTALLPGPAERWLRSHGARIHLGRRVKQLAQHEANWSIDGQTFNRVVLAASATESARLTQHVAQSWGAQAAAFDYEPIVTVYLHAPGTSLAAPMTALPTDAPDREPAQFAFDHGPISGRPGLYAFVVSGASEWLERGLAVTAQAVRAQAVAALRALPGEPAPTLSRIAVVRSVAERRATFACSPGLQRPPTHVAAGLAAAGDYVEGPYPATLEGAVRSAALALKSLGM